MLNGYVPARLATKVDPVVMLHDEYSASASPDGK
jgi:hypothetical protein